MDKHQITNLLRGAEARLPPGQLPTLSVPVNSREIEWHTFPSCSDGGFPGINVGQTRDCRYQTDGREGLHAQVFNDRQGERVEFHLDKEDACRAPVGHLFADTKVGWGLFFGGVAGLVAGLIVGVATRSWKKGLAVGAGCLTAGGAIGAFVPARNRHRLTLRQLIQIVRGR